MTNCDDHHYGLPYPRPEFWPDSVRGKRRPTRTGHRCMIIFADSSALCVLAPHPILPPPELDPVGVHSLRAPGVTGDTVDLPALPLGRDTAGCLSWDPNPVCSDSNITAARSSKLE